jgi:hypothetical protein
MNFDDGFQFESSFLTMYSRAWDRSIVGHMGGLEAGRAFANIDNETTDLRSVEAVPYRRHSLVRVTNPDAGGNNRIIAATALGAIDQAGTRTTRRIRSLATGAVFGIEFGDVPTSTGRVLLRKTGRTCETQTDRYTDIRSFDRDRQPLKCNSIHSLHFMSRSHVPLYFCTDAVIAEQMEYFGAAQAREAVWHGTVEGHWLACRS